jgi:carboxylesterase type B
MKTFSVLAYSGVAQVVTGFGGSLLSLEITLDYRTFKGVANPLNSVDSFLGMPFATAGRLENPKLPTEKIPGVFDATQYGPACPQQELVASPLDRATSKSANY